MCDLLNLTYDYELENLNREKMNYPGIDLGDRYDRVAVQIASEPDRENKVERIWRLLISEILREEEDQEQEPETPYAREHAERVQMKAEKHYLL